MSFAPHVGQNKALHTFVIIYNDVLLSLANKKFLSFTTKLFKQTLPIFESSDFLAASTIT